MEGVERKAAVRQVSGIGRYSGGSSSSVSRRRFSVKRAAVPGTGSMFSERIHL